MLLLLLQLREVSLLDRLLLLQELTSLRGRDIARRRAASADADSIPG